MKEKSIFGVEIKLLKSHPDSRGFFREVIRVTDSFFDDRSFAQWSHSKMEKGVVKAWHYHHQQTDWWYIPIGEVQAVLFDNREESPTYKMKQVLNLGEASNQKDTLEACIKIPPGVLHGCQVLSEVAHLFYITSKCYNPEDEGRFPYNSEVVPHDWSEPCIVAENDRRTFVPTATRAPLN